MMTGTKAKSSPTFYFHFFIMCQLSYNLILKVYFKKIQEVVDCDGYGLN